MYYLLQNEQTHKCQEILQLRTEHRELKDLLLQKDTEISTLSENCATKEEDINNLKEEIRKLTTPQQYDSLDSLDKNYEETERLRAEIKELREELSDMSLNDYSGIEPGRVKRSDTNLSLADDDDDIKKREVSDKEEIDDLKKELDRRTRQFESERRTWAQEKEKVLKYQRQLQLNYVQIYRRSRALEAEIENLTVELELDKTGMKSKLGLSQTIEL